MATIECDACSCDASSGKDFLCVCCARSSIYLTRLESAKVLLEKHELGKQIEIATAPGDAASKATKPKDHARVAWRNEAANAQKINVREKIDQTKSHIETLRQEMENAKEEIAKRKADLIDRRKALEIINTMIPPRQKDTIDTITEVRDKGTVSFNSVNKSLLSTRSFLCRETSTLLRLRCRKRMKDGTVKDQYSIAGLILPDLRDINTVRCTDLSAALSSVAHLLTLISFYLGIRLPAEMTLPHRNYPLATINTPANSYLGRKVAFPGSGSISTVPSSPFSSKHDVKSSHRPRPLFLGSDDRDEKVAQLAKRDPSAFNFFVEGISLLAWNVAWLNRSQGFTAGTSTWEEVCNMGRNLCTLLATPQSPAMQRILSDREARKQRANNQKTSSPPPPPSSTNGMSTPTQTMTIGKLASTSHLTSHPASMLSSPANIEPIKTWKYSKYPLISDALKKHLMTEMNNAEWEILQEQEWDDGGEIFEGANTTDAAGAKADDAVFVGGKKKNSVNTTTPGVNEERDASAPASNVDAATANINARGGSGWTKIRGRNK